MLGGGLEQSRDLVGIVLAVSVQRDHALGAAGQRGVEAAAQRLALPSAAAAAARARRPRAATAALASEEPSSTTTTVP